MAELTKEFLQHEYWELEKSPKQIAAENDTNSNKVRRELLRHWEVLRTREEAQRAALASGRQPHPTKGVGHSPETRAKLAERASEREAAKTPEAKAAASAAGRESWRQIPVLVRKAIPGRGRDAVRGTVGVGSKAERHCASELRARGFSVTHREGPHGDLFLPDLGVAVFVDGPPLFEPIWGEAALLRSQENAANKRAKALADGFTVVRVCVRSAKPSRTLLTNLLTNLLNVLEYTRGEPSPAEYEVDA